MSLKIFIWNWNLSLHFSLFFNLSHTNRDSLHKTHFEIRDENVGAKFVFVYMWYQKAYIQKKHFQSHHCNDAIVYKNWNTHRKHAEWLWAWGCLFAVCLYSNMSFMQSFTEALCVVHFGPVCRADGCGGHVVVFLTSFFNIGQCCL